MTRINVGVMPSELHYKHLLAEHREIKRIPNAIAKGKYNLNNIPDKFTLGTGHVKFFYNKLLYLHFRYLDLYAECVKRGFNVTCYNSCFFNMPDELYNDYTTTKDDRQIILERIAERTQESKVM